MKGPAELPNCISEWETHVSCDNGSNDLKGRQSAE